MSGAAFRLRRAPRLPRRLARLDVRAVAWMGVWLLVLPVLIRLVPLPRLASIVTPRRISRRLAAARLDGRTLAAWADALMRRRPFGGRNVCWKRAFVVYRLLRLAGAPAAVCFGVRRAADGALAGHAWVEVDRVPVPAGDGAGFAKTFSYPDASAPRAGARR